MKFNTKTCTPMDKTTTNSAFVSNNAFIPTDRMHESSSSNNNNNNNEGRTVFYEAVLVSTPVLASARVNHHDSAAVSPAPRALLGSSQVDELSDMLNSLTIGGGGGGTTTSNATTTPPRIPQPHPAPRPVAATHHGTGGLGRCETSVCNSKTHQSQTVLRSARLLSKKNSKYQYRN